jgi:hypothetical protein
VVTRACAIFLTRCVLGVGFALLCVVWAEGPSFASTGAGLGVSGSAPWSASSSAGLLSATSSGHRSVWASTVSLVTGSGGWLGAASGAATPEPTVTDTPTSDPTTPAPTVTDPTTPAPTVTETVTPAPTDTASAPRSLDPDQFQPLLLAMGFLCLTSGAMLLTLWGKR